VFKLTKFSSPGKMQKIKLPSKTNLLQNKSKKALLMQSLKQGNPFLNKELLLSTDFLTVDHRSRVDPNG
jgi:hypothetical protein